MSLILLAAGIGAGHTLAGPDHYVPFIAMSRAGRWSLLRTLGVTTACGLGHVLGSVLLGVVGVLLGLASGRLEQLQEFRGDLAAWLLLGFGVAYLVWGIRQAILRRPHAHLHAHGDGKVHSHSHTHHTEHAHLHRAEGGRMTPWILFTIFVFGPCEALIPAVIYPAAKLSVAGVAIVVVVFAAATIATMLAMVTAAWFGLARLGVGWLERYLHAATGLAITLCGLAIQLGL